MSGDIFFLVIQFLDLLLSLSIHESAHAWTADVLGDPTPRYLGRVSLNPLVPGVRGGTFFFPLMGMFLRGGALFGWAKPVPVNFSRLRNPSRDHMIVAAAGPASNLLLALGLLVCLMISKGVSADAGYVLTGVRYGQIVEGSPIMAPLMAFAYYGVIINLILAVVDINRLA